MKEIDSFINKDVFTTLIGCIGIVELFTECVKYLLPEIDFILWIVLIFSTLVSLIRLRFSNDFSKENIILTIINIIPIFLGSVGVYQVGVKPITKLLLQ